MNAMTPTFDLEQANAFIDKAFPGRAVQRVLLVNPPDADSKLFRLELAKRQRYANYPPYGLGMLATHLRRSGYAVDVVNLNSYMLQQATSTAADRFDFDRIWQEKLTSTIEKFNPDLIGVSCLFSQHHDSLKNVVNWLAQNHQIPLACGGVHISNNPEWVLDDIPDLKFAFLQEADVSLLRFLDVVNGRRPASELCQIILNDRGRRIFCMVPAIPGPEDIDAIPALDLMDVATLSDFGTIGIFYMLKEPGTRFTTSLSNRGCRAHCTFCSVRSFNGVGVRHRNVSTIVDELEILEKEYGIGHVMWLDDDLLKDHARAVSLFNEMVRRNLKLTWDATNGVIAASLTEEVVAAAAASGCIGLAIGVESGNPAILKQIRKPGKPETFLRAAEVVRKYEQIFTTVLLMVGFPQETMRQIFDTIELARKMDLDWYRVSPLQPLPGTPIHDTMVTDGLLAKDGGSTDARYVGGPFGKQSDIEQGVRPANLDFFGVFSNLSLDEVPDREMLTDIYSFMQYHLNFKRTYYETRPLKIEQKIAFMRNIADKVAPDNGFALYFMGLLEHRQRGHVDKGLVERLRHRLETSEYWRTRFEAFDMSMENLEKGLFEPEHRLSLERLTARA